MGEYRLGYLCATPNLRLTKNRSELFNVWAGESLVGKRLVLRVTHEDTFRLQNSLKPAPEGSVGIFFYDRSKPFGVSPIIYNIYARISAEQATVFGDLESRTAVKIGGRITRYILGRTYKDDLCISVELENVSVERCDEPTTKASTGVRGSSQDSKPTSKPSPRVVSREEQAVSRIGLARVYMDSGMKEKAIGLLRSVIADFPETKATVQAQQELDKLGPLPSKKE